jgi:hypothetical protein
MDFKEENNTRDQIANSRNRKSNRPHMAVRRACILTALLVLIIIGGSIGYTTLYQPYAQRIERTAAINARIEKTALAKVTQTAQVVATLTSQAYATATTVANLQHSYNEMTTAVPNINDDLHTPDVNNWETGSGCSFTHSAYTINVQEKGFFLPCLAKNIQVKNFVYQVDMDILSGDAGGLIIRAKQKNTQSYIFVVGQDSSYSLYYYAGNAQKAAQPLTDGYSDLIKTGYNHVNTLGVLASGSSLDFYINRTYVTSIVNASMTTGQVGLLANNYKSSTEVTYTHAKIWKL